MAVYTGKWKFLNNEHPRHGAFGSTRVQAATDNLAKIAIREAGARAVFGVILMFPGFVATEVKRKGRGRKWHTVR